MTEEEAQGYIDKLRAGQQQCEATFAASDGSAASLKAEIGALKEKRSKFWWHDRPNNGDLLEVLTLLDKLAAVTERIEKQLPPNSPAHRPAR